MIRRVKLTVKGTIGKKFIKNRKYLLNQDHWQFIIVSLELNFFPVFVPSLSLVLPCNNDTQTVFSYITVYNYPFILLFRRILT